jgi:hypothetical protein
MWQATHPLEGETGQTEVAVRWGFTGELLAQAPAELLGIVVAELHCGLGV